MEETSFVLAGVNMMETIVSEVVGDIADSKSNPEEGEEDGVWNSDDFDAEREEQGDFHGK